MCRAVALLLALAACRDPKSRIDSCADPLGGVWTSGDRRYQVLDDGKTVALFPMWDTTRLPGGGKPAIPALSPRRIELARPDLGGTDSFRLTTAEETCKVSVPAHLEACAGDDMTLITGQATLSCHPDVSSRQVRLHRE